MKNLILTFVFALVSLVSVSQTLEVTVTGDITDTIYAKPISGTNFETLFLHVGDTVTFNRPSQINWLIGTTHHPNVTSVEYNATSITTDSVIVSNQVGNFKFYVKVEAVVGTSENTLTREELKVYPSPATSETKISFFADKSDMVVNIFSLNGQLIYQDDASREVGAINIVELNVSEWLRGVYLVRIGNSSQKLIIE